MKFRDLNVGDKFVFVKPDHGDFKIDCLDDLEVYIKKSMRTYETVAPKVFWRKDLVTNEVSKTMRPMKLQIRTINAEVNRTANEI
jgi:hypothetical protein